MMDECVTVGMVIDFVFHVTLYGLATVGAVTVGMVAGKFIGNRVFEWFYGKEGGK